MITCTFENGNSTQSLRHIVIGAIIVKDNQILLERRAKHMTCGGKVAIPGGYVDHGERISDAAIREVYEETGYRITNPTLFLINDVSNRKQDNGRDNIEFTYFATAGEKEGEIDSESVEVFWSPLNNLPPASDWAFDHYEEVATYLSYLKNPCPLPITTFSY